MLNLLSSQSNGAGVHAFRHTVEMSTLAERLVQALDEAGKTQSDLARELKVTRSAVAQWCSGETEPTGKNTRRAAKFLGRPSEWLETGRGKGSSIRRSDSEFVDTPSVHYLREGEHGGVSTLARYRPKFPGGMPDIDVSAGAGPGGLPLPTAVDSGGIMYSGDAVRGEIVLPDYLVAEFTRAPSALLHWIRVRGDSMSGTVEPGDRVGVDTSDTAIGGGGVFVIRDWDGEIQVKRLRKAGNATPAMVIIVSDNEKQGNATVTADTVTIIGRVVARISRVG